MRLLVNIRGCNGSGKSTIPMQMMENDPEYWVWDIIGSDKKKIASFTVFPNLGWIALGTYFNKTGGLDTISGPAVTRMCLLAALDAFPEYNVLMEGIIASTTFSSYSEMFKEVQVKYWKSLKILVVSLLPPVEVAIERVYQRNGGKPIKEELIQAKWGMVYRSHKKFKDAGFDTVRVDSSKVPKDRMMEAFLKTVYKRLGE